MLAAVALLASCKGTTSTPPSTPPAATPAAAAGTGTQAPAAQAPDTLAQDMTDIVTRYRQNIVLAADQASLDEGTRERVTIVGRMIFDQNRHALDELSERFGEELTAAASSASAPPGITAFLERLEKHPDLRDGDKLAFKDTVGDLRAAIEALPQSPAWKTPLLTRLEEDQKALQEIQSLYEKELKEIFGRYETRGMTVRREAWDSYLTFLKGLFTRESILKSFEDSLQSLNEGMRGGGKAPSKEQNEQGFVLTGQSLPKKTLVLTFDDGPHPRHTAKILETLEKYKVKSIFFEVGQNVAVPAKNKGADAGTSAAFKKTSAASNTEKIIQSGHLLANHSLTHAFLPKLTEERLSQEIDNSRVIIETVSGTPVPLFRPPYGAFNEKVRTALSSRGMKAFLWNIDSLDWSDPIPTSIANRVVQEVEKQGRGVILLHDVHSQSVEALPLILETLQSRGYQFVLWDGTSVIGVSPEDGGTSLAVAAPTPSPAETNLYRESWAVVVGINDYKKWPKLSYAVNDANGVREMLVSKYRFKPENIQVLLDGDATRERILSALGDVLSDSEKVKRDDRVFVFFAGHGVTRKLPNGKSLGYIVPVDADTTNYQSQAISMTNFQDISEAIPAKHVFFVMDACYSGLALTRGAAPGGDVRKYLQEMTRRSTRQVLTAGGADEQVADQGPNGHSIFTWTLLQGLEGKADLNTDGFVTASELAAYVGPTVSSLSRQTPAFGSMVGSEGGEFILQMNHDNEFLTESSEQLDSEALRLNAELDKVRLQIAEKQQRNQTLAKQLEEARRLLSKLEDGGTPAIALSTPAPSQLARQHNDQGLVLYREKRYAEALAEFTTAATLDTTNAQAANNVGYVHFKLGAYEESAKWLEKTVALDPARAVAYPNLGDAYFKLNRREDAVKAYERYLALLPTGPAAAAVKLKLAELRP